MINDERIQQHLIAHIRWVNETKPNWRAHRYAFADRFQVWERSGETRSWALKDGRVSGQLNESTQDAYPVEMNLLRPWVTSILSSLYYRGVRVVVEADEVPLPGEDAESRNRRTQGVRHLLNRFFASESFVPSSERMLAMSMMYRGGLAYQIHIKPEDDRIDKASAVDLISVDALPPWECVWDRRTRNRSDSRYRGYLYPMPIEDARAQWPGVPSDIEPVPLPDVVDEGFRVRRHRPYEDDSYVYILEFEDFTATTKEDGGARLAGVKSVFVVDNLGPSSPSLHRVARGPMPFSWHDGSPASQLVPYIAEPLAEFPLDSVAPAETIRQLNAELNRAMSVLAGCFRRDSARVVLALKKAGVDEETLTQIANARDLEMIEVEGSGPLSTMFQVLDWGQISPTLLQYRDMLIDAAERTQITADVSRGKAGEYLSATEVANLVNYTETTIGRLKKRSDDVIRDVANMYLRVLREAMDETGEASLTVRVGEGEYSLTDADLARRWKIQVIDTASTPTAAAQRLQDFMASLPTLMELAEAADPPVDGGVSALRGALASEALEYLVELMDLPPQFAPAVLSAQPQPVPPPPEPPQPAGAPPGVGPLPQQSQGAGVEGSPVTAAIVETVEGGF